MRFTRKVKCAGLLETKGQLFLVGAFFQKRASIIITFCHFFIDTPDLSNIVLLKVLQFCKVSQSLDLVVNTDFPQSKKKGYVCSSLALSQIFSMFSIARGSKAPSLDFFDTMRLFSDFF